MTIKERWIDFFYKAATGTKKNRTLLTPVGGVIFALLILLFVAAGLSVDSWLGVYAIIPSPLNIWIAVPLLVIGMSLTAWSVAHFFKAKGTPVPLNPPPELVKNGPYVYSRNPMLSGLFLMLFGVGILLRSLSMTLIFTPLFIFVNVWEVKMIEEPELEKRLGEPYVAYRKATPMFFPRIGNLKKKDG